MDDPPRMLGLRHVALFVDGEKFDAAVTFYRDGLRMRVEWQPDADNVYLGSGSDNLALHRAARPVQREHAALDHLGFAVPTAADVRRWHDDLAARAGALGIELLDPPREHRDGATSFYLRDPAGNRVQIIHLPGLVG